MMGPFLMGTQRVALHRPVQGRPCRLVRGGTHIPMGCRTRVLTGQAAFWRCSAGCHGTLPALHILCNPGHARLHMLQPREQEMEARCTSLTLRT